MSTSPAISIWGQSEPVLQYTTSLSSSSTQSANQAKSSSICSLLGVLAASLPSGEFNSSGSRASLAIWM